MNIKKNSFIVLGLVFGVSVILYIFDVRVTPSSTQLTPTVLIPTIIPTEQIVQVTTIPVPITTSVVTSPTISSLKRLSETVDYSVRRIPESITVNIALNGSTVTDLQLSQNPGSGQSAAIQDAFAAEIKSYVMGKNLKDINVSRVAGASYTTNAFMQAIKKMQTSI